MAWAGCLFWILMIIINVIFKGQVAWISEKQRLPVKNLRNGSFLRRLRNICAYLCQSDGRGGIAGAWPAIVRKELGALAWNRGHLPFLSKKKKQANFSVFRFSSRIYTFSTFHVQSPFSRPIRRYFQNHPPPPPPQVFQTDVHQAGYTVFSAQT